MERLVLLWLLANCRYRRLNFGPDEFGDRIRKQSAGIGQDETVPDGAQVERLEDPANVFQRDQTGYDAVRLSLV